MFHVNYFISAYGAVSLWNAQLTELESACGGRLSWRIISSEGRRLRKHVGKKAPTVFILERHICQLWPICTIVAWLMCFPHVSLGWMSKRLDCAALRKTERDGGNLSIVACWVSCNPPCQVEGLGLIPRSHQTIITRAHHKCATLLRTTQRTHKKCNQSHDILFTA